MTTQHFKRTERAIFARVGADIVALNVELGSSYGMEKVAATVWELLEQPHTLVELCGKLIEIYEIDPITCRAELEALLTDFEAEGLVDRCSHDS